MKQKESIEISVIIPAYNVEEYLEECIHSVLNQKCRMEIIIINDGSTDTTLDIIKSYYLKYDNIIRINQEHSGPSIARNQGLEIAKGEYIAFIDSDDWISPDSLSNLFHVAKQNELDMILGNMTYYYSDDKQSNIFDIIPHKLKNIVLSGEKCFISLMETGSYYPMACSFICRRDWIEKHKLRFDKHIIHEDEVWTQIALCLADKVMMTDLDFYYYRKREGSIMHTLNVRIRTKSLFHIANRFIEFAHRYKFEGENKVIKSWIYVNAFRIYKLAFSLLASVKDSSFKLPKHYLYQTCHIYRKITPDAQKRIHGNYLLAKTAMQKYLKWKLNPWNVYLSHLTQEEVLRKRVILIYNNPEWHQLELLRINDILENYIITTDRKYYNQAYAVVFHLPNIYQSMEDDLDKSDNQLWVAWNMECEENYPWMKDEAFLDLFDIRMDYHKDSDIVCSYVDVMCSQYAKKYKKEFLNTQNILKKENKICMIISSPVNQSRRIEYIKELMQYIEIDSFGKLFNNKQIENDNGRDTKFEIYSKYKFVIAFENAIGDDYVTEKFYDPLLVGTVPIYMGAPNIEEFIPGNNCYIDIRDYKSPEELANYLKKCFLYNNEYMKYHTWKQRPLYENFTEGVEIQKESPFIRLCEFLEKSSKR